MWAKLTCVLQRKTNQISFLKECYTILFLGNFLSFFFPTNSQLLTNIYWTQFCRAIPLETHFPSWRIITQLSLTAAAAAAKSLQSCPTLCDPIDGSHQAPPSLGFSRQEHWSGLPFPSLMHESECEVAQSCPTPIDPMDCSPPGSSVHGVFQARVLEWGAIALLHSLTLPMLMKLCICFGICLYSKWFHIGWTFFLFSNLGLIMAQ